MTQRSRTLTAALALVAPALLLSGCTPSGPPPTPTALCAAFGYTQGTPAYADCVQTQAERATDRTKQDAIMKRLFSGAP
ncbi:hypothetical protein AA700_1253 [Acidiphilium acidophilum DSM 700]|nr:hypothetical protein AA700_1253 [Acidiphilium acidophilum DSM 700]